MEMERAFAASLHGAKYKPHLSNILETKEIADFTKEQDDLLIERLKVRMSGKTQQR